MTTYAITEEHCQHECCCWRWDDSDGQRKGIPCPYPANCPDDTRKHPLPATAAPDAPAKFVCPLHDTQPNVWYNNIDLSKGDPLYIVKGSELVQLCLHHIHDGLIMSVETAIRAREVGDHDAALLAAAREKWERDCAECKIKPRENFLRDHDARIRADAAKAERERVLKPFIEYAESLHTIESSFIKFKLNEIVKKLRASTGGGP